MKVEKKYEYSRFLITGTRWDKGEGGAGQLQEVMNMDTPMRLDEGRYSSNGE